MYKKDYMMTMIEELALFLGRLLFLRETRRFDIAIQEIDEFCIRLFRRTAGELVAMPHEDLVALCTNEQGEPDVLPTIGMASMLKELGDIVALRAEPGDDPCSFHTRSLALFLHVYGNGTRALPAEVPERIELVVEKSAACDLPSFVKLQLFRFLELRGFYSDAEDLLFELIDEAAPNAREEGLAFYDRLSVKDDDDLANGDLPREEIAEGRDALLRM